MTPVIVLLALLLAVPAAAQPVPKIDPQSCLNVAKKLDATAWDNLSEETKSYSKLCFAAYSCPKQKQMMMNWDYAKDGDAPWDGDNENEKPLRWRMQVCGE